MYIEDNYHKLNVPFVCFPVGHIDGNINVYSYTAAGLHLGGLVCGANNNNYLHMEHNNQSDLIRLDMTDRIIKNQIATHPLYPNLLSAFLECQKVIYYSTSFNSS